MRACAGRMRFMNALLPFEVNYSPITKLVLINFEKNPDKIYSGLELQYMEGEHIGKGYRIIAYRCDKYVDVYDENTLRYLPDERFDVTQKGLRQHVQRKFDNLCCERKDGRIQISFTFMDCENRKIEVAIREHTWRKSTPMNLLAPIGLSSEKPSYLPVFLLYDFDFVRRGKTFVSIVIGGQKLKLDPFPFPVPMNLQWRYYTRYSLDSQIFEFLNTDSKQLRTVNLNSEGKYIETKGHVQTEYGYTKVHGNMALSEINIKQVQHPLQIAFEPPVSLEETQNGSFHIIPEQQMGSIDGSYQVVREAGKVRITVKPEGGWRPAPSSGITKMILGEKSIFRNWSKKYTYEQEIDREDLSSRARWTNLNMKQSK
jgi:hypothetical protein